MSYPISRLTRLRADATRRRAWAEHRPCPADLWQWLTIGDAPGDEGPLGPVGLARAEDLARQAARLGLAGLVLSARSRRADALGASLGHGQSPLILGIRALKKAAPGLVLLADCSLSPFTTQGLPGVVDKGRVDADASLEVVAQAALACVKAGADGVALPELLEGRVGEVRESLEEAGHDQALILSVPGRLASVFAGPLDAKALPFAQDPAATRAVVRLAALEADEGADLLATRPALCTLDLVAALREEFDLPIAAWQDITEARWLLAGAAAGLFDQATALAETMLALKRAGADLIISPLAVEAARALGGE